MTVNSRRKPASPETFWTRFHALRATRLPVESGLYEVLDKYYRAERRRFDRGYRNEQKRNLPPTTRDFYNSCFAEVRKCVAQVLSASTASRDFKMRALAAYDVSLGRDATLEDLVRLDPFSDKTMHQDFPDEVLRGVPLPPHAQREGERTHPLHQNTYHFFLHSAQKTELLFLHELVVGYLVNTLVGRPIPSREVLPAGGAHRYWELSAHALVRLGALSGLSDADMVSLHFYDNDDIRGVIPPFVQDLMLVSAHLFSYLDLYQINFPSETRSPATLLALLLSFFIIPSIDREAEGERLRLRANAGKYLDDVVCDALFHRPPSVTQVPNDVDVVRLLVRLVDSLWVKRSRTG